MPLSATDGARARTAEAQRVSGLALYAASARNMAPRLLSSLCVAMVGGPLLGWIFTGGWLSVVWASMLLNRWLMREAEEDPRARTVLHGASLAGVIVHAVMFWTLWAFGDPLVKAFALTMTFIASAYMLLQYYANAAIFRLLLTPYWLLMAAMALDLAARAQWKPAAVATLAAALIAVGNFFVLARRQLARSRSVMRQARAEARDGMQAAEAANAAKSTFLATMSHEIRTPLNGVLGMAQAMAGEKLSKVQRDRLAVIQQSGEALLAILNDVLDLSKIEAGRLDLEHIEFDLAEVVRGAYSAFTALANKKGLSFAVDIDAARGRYMGDPTRVRQILYNLISNALKFTEHGEVRVTAVRRGEVLEISVADTGVGISEEGMARLFGKFDQLDSSTTRKFGGTGLGLAICRELAALMGGAMAVESEVGKGSRFILTAPLARVGEERPPRDYAPPPPSEREALSLRVLAAEDNAVNQLVLKTLLHQLGVDPVVVESGTAAIEAWQTGDWDVILMDIQMPDMDGVAATARIRELEQQGRRKRTPIVALTANAMSHHIESYLAAGMDGHVAKPIQAMALFEALAAAAEGRAPGAKAKVA